MRENSPLSAFMRSEFDLISKSVIIPPLPSPPLWWQSEPPHSKRLYFFALSNCWVSINLLKMFCEYAYSHGYIDKNFFKVSFGNIITGEAVVNNQKEKLKAIERAYGCDITAGEMEGYGLAKECIYYSHIPCLIIKAI